MKEHNVKLFHHTNAPQRHRLFHYENNRCLHWAGAFSKSRNVMREGELLCLVGKRGTGKTCLAVQLIAIGKGVKLSSWYEKALDFWNDFRFQELGETRAYKKYLKPDILVLDALEKRRGTDEERRLIQSVIDKRYDLMKKTIIVSNDTPSSLFEFLGHDVYDRLCETGSIVEFNSESFRRAK